MSLQKLYYFIKPVFPRSFQLWLRRMRVRFTMKKYKSVWPIDPVAGKQPEGWQGWPDGKKFALVLTHDVDTFQGQKKCIDLMKLEQEAGFFSAFFFVPEKYPIDYEAHKTLRNNGFEIGVHGLKHDGRLYHSKKIFAKRANRINKYIIEWQARGFRSPCMHHNLDWIHDLNIEYDASTYDIDPFEPQGGGVKTIFPYKVNNNITDKSYIELPYTLSQDHFLFIIMQETSINFWIEKLDWIAQHGGMALLLTHPDYMNFNHVKNYPEEYPVSLYMQFLQYIKSRYNGSYWLARPQQISQYCSMQNNINSISTTKHNYCMLVYSYYPQDPRVRREAEALAEKGYTVHVICLRGPSEPPFDIIKGVTVYRMPMMKQRKGKLNYIKDYFTFILYGFFKLTILNFKYTYNTVHIHNMPDVLVFCAAIPRLTGSKIVLDLHDPMPEVYMTKYDIPENHFAIKILQFLEKLCIRFSHLVITPNIAFERLFLSRSCEKDKIHIVMNSPQEDVFNVETQPSSHEILSSNSTFKIMYHGTIVERHGLDTALESLNSIRDIIPSLEFHVYGSGDFVDSFLKLVRQYNLDDIVHYHGITTLENIAAAIKTINLGLIPNKRSPFTEINMPTRIFEYLCLGKPVIAPRTLGVLDYFKEDDIFYFEPGNAANLADVILSVIKNPENTLERIKNGMNIYNKYSWEIEKTHLTKAVSNMFSD